MIPCYNMLLEPYFTLTKGACKGPGGRLYYLCKNAQVTSHSQCVTFTTIVLRSYCKLMNELNVDHIRILIMTYNIIKNNKFIFDT